MKKKIVYGIGAAAIAIMISFNVNSTDNGEYNTGDVNLMEIIKVNEANALEITLCPGSGYRCTKRRQWRRR